MQRLKDRSSLLIALVAILPIGILAIASAIGNVGNLANPCFRWGVFGGPIAASSTGSCNSAGASSQTVVQMLSGLTIVQGGILLGTVLGISGIIKSSRIFLVISSAILSLESLPLILGGSFILTLIPALLFMTLAIRLNAKDGYAPPNPASQ